MGADGSPGTAGRDGATVTQILAALDGSPALQSAIAEALKEGTPTAEAVAASLKRDPAFVASLRGEAGRNGSPGATPDQVAARLLDNADFQKALLDQVEFSATIPIDKVLEALKTDPVFAEEVERLARPDISRIVAALMADADFLARIRADASKRVDGDSGIEFGKPGHVHRLGEWSLWRDPSDDRVYVWWKNGDPVLESPNKNGWVQWRSGSSPAIVVYPDGEQVSDDASDFVADIDPWPPVGPDVTVVSPSSFSVETELKILKDYPPSAFTTEYVLTRGALQIKLPGGASILIKTQSPTVEHRSIEGAPSALE